jgi:hypothetical protein
MSGGHHWLPEIIRQSWLSGLWAVLQRQKEKTLGLYAPALRMKRQSEKPGL